METRYLHSFVAICDHGSFAEAARRLDLTPAALAARIKTLEDEVGASLVVRAGRGARPTEAGVRILERARLLLKDARDLQAVANDRERLGELRLGVATSTLAEFTPDLLKRLYRRHPTLRIFVESGASTHLYQRAVARAVDAAIVAEPVHAMPKGFRWELLKEERLVLLVPAGSALEDPDVLLATKPFLRFDRSLRGGQAVDAYLHRRGIVPNERLEIDALTSIGTLVRDGVGVALVPDWAPEWLDSIGVVRIGLSDSTPMRRMGVLWDVNGVGARLVDALLDEARALLEQSSPLEASRASGSRTGEPAQPCECSGTPIDGNSASSTEPVVDSVMTSVAVPGRNAALVIP